MSDPLGSQSTPLLRATLTAAIVINSLTLLVAITVAVLVEVQDTYLVDRSEQTGSYNPGVFPPLHQALWLISIMFPVLITFLLIVLIVARIIAGTRNDRRLANLPGDALKPLTQPDANPPGTATEVGNSLIQ